MYGIRQHLDTYSIVLPIFAQRLIAGEPITVFGDGEQKRDFINVMDVGRANLAAGVNCGVSGSFNVGSGDGITINRLVEMIQCAARLSTSVVYCDARKSDVGHSIAHVSAMRDYFGWEPQVSLESGLTEYMSWAKQAFLQPVV